VDECKLLPSSTTAWVRAAAPPPATDATSAGAVMQGLTLVHLLAQT